MLHLLPAFQVYAQTFFATAGVLRVRHNPQAKPLVWWQRCCWRALYVAICTAIGALLPFFSSISSLVGAVQFWPLVVLYPILLWIRIRQPSNLVRVLLHILSTVCFVLTCCALCGAAYSLVDSVSTFSIGGQ